MGCFKAVLDRVKKDVQRKMGNMPTLNLNDDKFERITEERSSKKSLDNLLLPNWMEDNKVAMDFRSGNGQIVINQKEIDKIRNDPGQLLRVLDENIPIEKLQHGPYLTQKYYHQELSRPHAEKLLKAANYNGAWLLRTSQSRKNCLTISYIYEQKVHHMYVTTTVYYDEKTKERDFLVTMDLRWGFRDVHDLTEYYRHKKGHLSCRLGASIKNDSQPDGSPVRSPFRRTFPKPIDLMAPPRKSSNKSKIKGSFFTRTFSFTKEILPNKKLGDQPSTSKEEASSSGVSSAQNSSSGDGESVPSTPQA
ncbi:unnamed protein product [Ceutorhynchus assimilis]|uniref:SH2 domain-containing protein n=1 Tax=Ceutorhynchus assimilis TaxID=467358 RepID=A0A9N9QFV2_9CUCU|nr:unnamed protein product [Ceutorhynchus assimilis]